MTEQDKQRIEKEANDWVDYNSGGAFHLVPSQSEAYIAGATLENERMLDEINTEKHLVNVYKLQANTAHAVIKELLRAIYHGEMELRITYERHTSYKGGSSLWLMQEMLEKYKSFLDKGKSQ